MRTPSRVLVTLLSLAALQLILSSDALAIVLRHEPLTLSAARATDIVTGRIVAATPRWGNERREWIVTDYTVVVDDAIRAAQVRARETITITLWGGTIGDESWEIEGLVHPQVGDAFVFLLKPGDGARRFVPIGHAAGMMKIVAREGGERVVVEHDGAQLAEGRSAKAFALHAGRSAEAFALHNVREILAATAYDAGKASEGLDATAGDLPSARVRTSPYQWFGVWPGRIPISPFGSWARGWQGLDRVEIDKWGYYADLWDIRADTDTWHPRDGIVDLIGWPASSVLQPVFGYSWEPNVVGVTFTLSRGLTIVDATVALNPAYSWTTNDAAVFRGDSNAVSFAYTTLHELGHVIGLDHNFFGLSIMNYPPLGFDAVALIYGDDARGARALYPSRASARTDLGVHLYSHGSNAGQYLDATFPATAAPGSTFTLANWSVENSGTATVSPAVELWLQSALDPASPAVFLRNVTMSPPLQSGQYYNPASMTTPVTVPASTPPGQYHLMAFVRGDGGPVIGKFPFGNNWGYSRRRITIGGTTGPLAPPVNLTAAVSGTTVTFTWQHPASGPPASYVLEAGTQTSFSTAAPAGTFYVRLRSSNGVTTSAASNEVVFTIGGTTPGGVPGAPTSISATVIGSTITVTWTPPATGVVTGYVLEAGTAPGLSNVANAPVGLVTTFTATGVPSGTYYLRVRAVNASGAGAPSVEVQILVP